jgi:hypothetical protein
MGLVRAMKVIGDVKNQVQLLNFLMMRLECTGMNARRERLFAQDSLSLPSRASVLGDNSGAWKLLDMSVFNEK